MKLGRYYDRVGEPIESRRWSELLNRIDYRVVVVTEVGRARVSTVWLGLDHQYGKGPPLIFETMIFRDGKASDNEQWRYSTEAAARAGHELHVERLRSSLQ